MFTPGLTAQLVTGVRTLCRVIPALNEVLQNKLLDLVALILSGEPYRHPGTPDRVRTKSTLESLLSAPAFCEALAANQASPDTQILALTTLGGFDFGTFFLHRFVETVVFTYLENEDMRLRKQAALTTLQLIATPTWATPPEFVNRVLRKLLGVCVSDRHAEVERLQARCTRRWTHLLCVCAPLDPLRYFGAALRRGSACRRGR